MSRYDRREVVYNEEREYFRTFAKRGVHGITQYRTFEREVYEKEIYDSIEVIDHTWKFGDAYWKLSSIYYGDPQYWWVIASFNNRPTEANNKIGDNLKIPVSLSEALQVVE